MAIAFRGGPIDAVQAGGTSMPLASYTCLANSLVALFDIQYDAGGPTITTPTATNGNVFVAATAQRTRTADTGIRIYYEKASVAGATVATLVSGSGTSDFYGALGEFTGLDNTSPLDQVTATGGSGTSAAASATSGTTTQADELVLGIMSCATGGTIAVTGGATQLQEDETFTGSSSWRIVSSTGTQVASWTNPNSAWIADVATFKAAVSAFTDNEIFGRPFGERGERQMQQLLAS